MFFTSEAAMPGHPDKVCDQVADAILDAILAKDPAAFVACEVTACKDQLNIMGEVTSSSTPDYESIARGVLRDIGYTVPGRGFDADSCKVQVDIQEQSPDIARSVERPSSKEDAGAGDQGVSFGYACDETPDLMPVPITLANELGHRLELVREMGIVPHLRLDGKMQVSVEYSGGQPSRVDNVIVSIQHDPEIDIDELRDDIADEVVDTVLEGTMADEDTTVYVNPTGRFVYGGPSVDAGLTGHKTVSDTYGGFAHFGGSSLSGKDPSKMDRTGAYMARYIAKNVVAANLARRCEVQLAYSIGLADPVCLSLDTQGTGLVHDESIAKWVLENIDLRPAMIIRRFNLRRPIYRALSCYGHFGRNAREMPWEQADLAARMASEVR